MCYVEREIYVSIFYSGFWSGASTCSRNFSASTVGFTPVTILKAYASIIYFRSLFWNMISFLRLKTWCRSL